MNGDARCRRTGVDAGDDNWASEKEGGRQRRRVNQNDGYMEMMNFFRYVHLCIL